MHFTHTYKMIVGGKCVVCVVIHLIMLLDSGFRGSCSVIETLHFSLRYLFDPIAVGGDAGEPT